MGLDLYRRTPTEPDVFNPNKHVRMGSYSGVHVFRRMVVEAYIKRALDDPQQPENGIRFAEELVEGSESDLGCGIRYSVFADTPLTGTSVEFRGLCLFVDHSDCDGEHHPEQLTPILAFLDYVEPAIPEDGEVWFEKIRTFYSQAAANGETVVFA